MIGITRGELFAIIDALEVATAIRDGELDADYDNSICEALEMTVAIRDKSQDLTTIYELEQIEDIE